MAGMFNVVNNALAAYGAANIAVPIGTYLGNMLFPNSSASSNQDSAVNSIFDQFKEYLSDITRNESSQLDRNMIYNAQQAQAQREFNAAEAQKNREWQERMSNTSYQRAVQDMLKAGLNPILAFQHGGASTPSGSSATSNAASMSTGGGVSMSDLVQLLGVLTGAFKSNNGSLLPTIAKILISLV